jgi:nicotinamide-nucleotide amidase
VTRVRAHLLMIGDELLAGDIVDTNKAWLGRRCRALGLEVVRASTIRDRHEEIVAAMREAAEGVEICLVSGGLGPTTDDLTVAGAGGGGGCGMG